LKELQPVESPHWNRFFAEGLQPVERTLGEGKIREEKGAAERNYSVLTVTHTPHPPRNS